MTANDVIIRTSPVDHSHFERVIEMLKKVDGQAKEESNEDESAGVMHDEEDLTPETTTVCFFLSSDFPVICHSMLKPLLLLIVW